jgi:peptidoglycan hydrolase-like protein with peptidoglycan-binding domain
MFRRVDSMGETVPVTRARILRPASVAALTLALTAVAGCSPKPASVSAPGTPTATASAGPEPSASPSASPSPSAAPSSSAPPAVTRTLKRGSSGPDVLYVQQQLTALGYWLGTPDGHYGGGTQQAVWALQKAAGLSRTGTVNAATLKAIQAGTRPKARSTSGHQIEVDLKHQLLLFVTDGHVDHILNTSTGGGYVYINEGNRNVAITPRGKFKTYRVIDGPRISSLGLLIRPRYFTGGYAIHGAESVPPYAASHGCVRVTNSAINWIWANKLDPIGTTVWIY